jgi:hypothetical protein
VKAQVGEINEKIQEEITLVCTLISTFSFFLKTLKIAVRLSIVGLPFADNIR